MSGRPPKKSDENKGWMRRRRTGSIPMKPPYHLIITEGTQTEPAYFKAIADNINRRNPGRVKLEVFGEGVSGLNLFKMAKKRVAGSMNDVQHVWIVFDKDSFSDRNFDEIDRLCRKTENDETVYHAIWSNECFEIWFLLHFSFMQSDISRTEYMPKLNACMKEIGAGTYAKNRQDMFAVLRPYLPDAIANAKRLEAANDAQHLPPSRSSPGTKVHLLMEKLMPYLQDEQNESPL